MATADWDQIAKLNEPPLDANRWTQISPCVSCWDVTEPLQNIITELFIFNVQSSQRQHNGR